MSELTGAETIEEGYFQCGWHGLKRGLHGGYTVDEAVKAVLEHRTDEPVFIEVFVRRKDGLVGRYSAKFNRGETRGTWSLSG